jgi:hypothetical protein
LRSSPNLTELLLSTLLTCRYCGPSARLFAVLRIRKNPLLLLCLTAALIAGGCARRPAQPETGPVLAGRWYQLADGAFEAVQAPGQPAVADLPWTVQARVSDMSSLDGRLYLAVNGYGLASVEAGRGAMPRFRYFYDPLLFRYRTLTTLVPAAGSLTCHLYFNSLLNLADAGQLPVRGLALLALHPQDGIYRQIQMPFQSSHRGWECVGFAPLSAQEFLLEWKLSEPERTLFEYTRYSLASSKESRAGRQEYRETWEPRPLEGRLPADIQKLAQELLARVEDPRLSLFLGVRFAGEPLCRRYARRPSAGRPEEGLLTAHAFLDGERRLLLASDGLLLVEGPGSSGSQASSGTAAGIPAGLRPAPRRLPALPAGFRYTDLFLLEGLLFAAWEQADFTTTGAAGIFISGEL